MLFIPIYFYLTLIWCIFGMSPSVISGKKFQNLVFNLWWRHRYRTTYNVMFIYDVITKATYMYDDPGHVTSPNRNITWWKWFIPKTRENPGMLPSVISGKKIQTKKRKLWSVISGKKFQNAQFWIKIDILNFFEFWEYHPASSLAKKSRHFFRVNFNNIIFSLNFYLS